MRRLAAVVDELRPDVVITNHSTDRGHGHHRATAEAIRDVLAERAASGWEVPLYERMFPRNIARAMGIDTGGGDGDQEEEPPPPQPDWQCDPFELDPVRGLTHARQANNGRHEHRTQGPWRPHDPTRTSLDHWKVVMPDAAAKSLVAHLGSLTEQPAFREVCSETGIDLDELRGDLAGFASDRTVREHVAAARALLPRLRTARERLPDSSAGRAAGLRLDRRLDALQRVVLAGSGVDVEVGLLNERLHRDGLGVARVLVHAVAPGRVQLLSASCREPRRFR